MGSLTYSAITSLDGFSADADGSFDWAAPDEEVHAFVNELERPVSTYLYGRRIYETMRFWETVDDDAPVMRDYAGIWKAADKIVYSSTLTEVDTARTTLREVFDASEIEHLKRDRDISIGGPTLAAHALKAGLVDSLHLFVNPVIIGGGLAALPDSVRLDLELADERRFASGVVHLHYRVRSASSRAPA